MCKAKEREYASSRWSCRGGVVEVVKWGGRGWCRKEERQGGMKLRMILR